MDTPPESALINQNSNNSTSRYKDFEIATGGGEAPASLIELPGINVSVI